MQSIKTILENFLNAMLPNRATPVLGRVIKAYEGPGKNRYSVDVRVLTAGTMEETDQVIAEVHLSPIWATKKKRGVYAIPSMDQVVIVEFVGWNPAYPYVSGIWADEYEADEFKKDQFVITDGNGMKFIIDATENKITMDNGKKTIITWEENKITMDNGKLKVTLNQDKFSVKNGSQSLFTMIDTALGHMATLAQNTAAHKTVGSPALHIVDKDDIQKFNLDKGNFMQDKISLAAIMEA
ncbi:MAG: phage baseplate assembly protein V [Spirochaetaceae bacterium]|jgi:hypothetical protein|nr:phage baseplate assembly protein V [Spirochaetaceae bacterium]